MRNCCVFFCFWQIESDRLKGFSKQKRLPPHPLTQSELAETSRPISCSIQREESHYWLMRRRGIKAFILITVMSVCKRASCTCFPPLLLQPQVGSGSSQRAEREINLLIRIYTDDYYQKKAAPAFLSERRRNLEANQSSASVSERVKSRFLSWSLLISSGSERRLHLCSSPDSMSPALSSPADTRVEDSMRRSAQMWSDDEVKRRFSSEALQFAAAAKLLTAVKDQQQVQNKQFVF